MTGIGIVGGGIMGLATAWALAKRGAAVTLFEQGPIPNPLGGSVDQHRLIRYAYGDRLGYTAMVARAFRAWDRLWADLGETLYAETGTLALEPKGGAWLEASAASMATLGIPFERLGADAVAERFPHLLPEGLDALYQPRGGMLFAGRIVELLAHRLAARGVALHARTRAAAIDPERGTIVTADRAEHGFDRILAAAGPWTAKLLPDFTARIVPARQVVVYAAPPPDLVPHWLAGPMVLRLGAGQGFYAVPPRKGTGLKIGLHRVGAAGDPDRDREPGRVEAEAILAEGCAHFRDRGRYRLADARTCFYDVAPEERFILAPIGAAGLAMAGFSGHGFKFAPHLGEVAAAVLLGDRDLDSARREFAGES